MFPISPILIIVTVGKIDCYGIPQDEIGRAVLKPFLRNNIGEFISFFLAMFAVADKFIEEYQAGDTLAWYEAGRV